MAQIPVSASFSTTMAFELQTCLSIACMTCPTPPLRVKIEFGRCYMRQRHPVLSSLFHLLCTFCSQELLLYFKFSVVTHKRERNCSGAIALLFLSW